MIARTEKANNVNILQTEKNVIKDKRTEEIIRKTLELLKQYYYELYKDIALRRTR